MTDREEGTMTEAGMLGFELLRHAGIYLQVGPRSEKDTSREGRLYLGLLGINRRY